MMKFALLCSGSKGNCFLLQDEHTSILIDCGNTRRYLSMRLEELGVAVSDIDALLITHTHTDHVSQLKMFADLPAYAPCDIGRPYTQVVSERPFQIEHLTITPLALSHDAENTTGYIIESWQEKLVYITDTGYVRDSYLPLIKGADYMILESNHDPEMLMNTGRPLYLRMRIAGDSGHLCNEDCADILTRTVTAKTKMIVLAHISEEANTRETALEVSREQLLSHHDRRKNLLLCAAGQKEMLLGGEWGDEKMVGGSCRTVIGLDDLAHRQPSES